LSPVSTLRYKSSSKLWINNSSNLKSYSKSIQIPKTRLRRSLFTHKKSQTNLVARSLWFILPSKPQTTFAHILDFIVHFLYVKLLILLQCTTNTSNVRKYYHQTLSPGEFTYDIWLHKNVDIASIFKLYFLNASVLIQDL